MLAILTLNGSLLHQNGLFRAINLNYNQIQSSIAVKFISGKKKRSQQFSPTDFPMILAGASDGREDRL